MNFDNLKREFLKKYLEVGEHKFINFLLLNALNKLILIRDGKYSGSSPEIEYLNYYNCFLLLYRREGEHIYLDIAKIIRKVSHKIYRVMLKKKMITHNPIFLNLV